MLRYIADLHFQKIDAGYLQERRKALVEAMQSDVGKDLSVEKFRRFIDENGLADHFFRLLPRHGILLDEGFPSQLHKAVRFLNDECGFSIQMILLEAFVDDNWNPEREGFSMRLDFTPIM